MKTKALLGLSLLFLLALAGCSSSEETTDNEGFDAEELEKTTNYEEYDAEYQIKYYSQPPYANEEQGYWHNDGAKDYFNKLTPNSEAPYSLLVCPKNEKGKQTLEHIAERKDSVILNIYHQVSLPFWSEKDSLHHYFVRCTKYFECPDLYVSDNYFAAGGSKEEVDSYRIVPMIIVSLKEGADIKSIEKKYKNEMTLIYTNDRGDARWTTYLFDCHLNNSYEVLRLAADLYKCDEVNWAEADMYAPIHLD